jgi:xanthine dehydrogenase accessory factor
VRNIYTELSTTLGQGLEVALITYLARGTKKLWLPGAAGSELVGGTVKAACESALNTGALQMLNDPRQGPVLVEPYYPGPRLVVLGGGHIACALVEFAARLGFEIFVADDRPAYANAARFPEAASVICCSFTEVFDQVQVTDSSFVVIMTRGHRHDVECLRQALRIDLAYLGMVSSRRRVRAVREQMLAEGADSGRLKQLHSPIGLAIGAETPAEIALAIAAELVSVRRVERRWPECDREVTSALAGQTPLAILTVVGRRGSVPRGVGAKMAVWPDGVSAGTIGGGCVEAEAVQSARQMDASQRFKVVHLDLTQEYGEDEGLACGGTVDVLIEGMGGATWTGEANL